MILGKSARTAARSTALKTPGAIKNLKGGQLTGALEITSRSITFDFLSSGGVVLVNALHPALIIYRVAGRTHLSARHQNGNRADLPGYTDQHLVSLTAAHV